MQLVASDLDGTLVYPDGTVSDRSIRALDACRRRGVDVVFVTGRPIRWMAPVAERTGHHGVSVCANGAAVYDLARGEILATHGLTAAQCLAAADALRGVIPGIAFALETTRGYRREPAFLPHHTTARAAQPGALPELLADDPVVLKMLGRASEMMADELLARARPPLRGIAEAVHGDSRGTLLELSAPGVSKASTLALLAAERGVSAAGVVAFGDMPNDVEMLRWAGTGYAMADGHPEVIAVADEIAPPCRDDGVAQVLERLLAGC